MKLTNQEKQARFRQKEGLKKIADKIFRDWSRQFHRKQSPQEVRKLLDKIIDLPSGWTQEDLAHAVKELNSFNIEVYTSNPFLLENDIHEARSTFENIATTPNPLQYHRNLKQALEQTKKLSSHLISTIELFGGSNADNAAAIMEVARHIGLLLVRERQIQKSNATAICLALINPLQKKPEWLIEKLSEALTLQLGDEKAYELGQKLSTKKIL